MAERDIERFLNEKKSWIERKQRFLSARPRVAPAWLPAAEEKELRERARDAFIERACFYAAKMGVEFKRIRLSSAKRRWGSCGPDGNLSFNWRLILAPADILDYVVVHELAHRVEHNHSSRFWAKVAEHFPEYKNAKRWLKEHRL